MNANYTKSYSSQSMPDFYIDLIRELEKNSIEYLFRWSSNHVPHIVINRGKGYSICWFKKSHSYRVFTPYPNCTNCTHKEDLMNISDIISYVRGS
jgi:hypothetical protein